MHAVGSHPDMTRRPGRAHRRPRRGLAGLLITCCSALVLVPCTPASATALSKLSALSALSAKGVKGPTIDIACLASFQFDFSPPLNNNTVSSQTAATLTSCILPNQSRTDLLSSVLFASRGHSTASGCSPLPLAINGVGTILWNDGTDSSFTFDVNTNPLSPKFGLAADIMSGTLAGDRITAVPLVISQEGLCGLGGVDSLSVNLGIDVFTH